MNETNKSLKELLADKLGSSPEKLDIAPEVEQEPFGYVREIRPREWKFSKTTSWGPDIWAPVYRFPLDAQAEIERRDARIAELEADSEKAQAAVVLGNYIGRKYRLLWCNGALASQVIDILQQQTAEISRLKGVIAKCEATLKSISYVEPSWATSKVREALAAIKEIDHATD